jgi:uncharacterized membrane protein
VAGPFLGVQRGFTMFRSLVTYCFAFSLILQGIGQMAITRWVADQLYSKRSERVLPAFTATLAATGLVHVAIGVVFSVLAGFSYSLGFLAVTLFATIGMTWIALTWLSLAREYDEVLRAYLYGLVTALGGMALLAVRADTVGLLGTYTLAQIFILARLIRVIARGMEAGGRRDLRVFRSLRKFPRLVALGVLYNAAIWIDKMVFWFTDGIGDHPWVRYHPLYDTCSFFAYLTVVPALAVNLVRLETSFYETYRAYYGAILGGLPLREISIRRKKMFENLKESTIRLLRVQGAISIAVIVFAPIIVDVLRLPPVAVRMLRLTTLGAFFHVLLLLTILMQLYFDLRTQALATSLVFLIVNGGLAWWSVERGVATFGIGYAIASFLSLLLGTILLTRSLERLDYLTFTSQKIGDQPEVPEELLVMERGTGEEEEEESEPPPQPEPAPEPEPESQPDPPPEKVVIYPEHEETETAREPEPEPAEERTATDPAALDQTATETDAF